MSELPQTTSSGRVVKRTGMNDSKKSALQKIREARQGNVKRTDQYEVSTILQMWKFDLTFFPKSVFAKLIVFWSDF